MADDGHRYTFGAPKGGWPEFKKKPEPDPEPEPTTEKPKQRHRCFEKGPQS